MEEPSGVRFYLESMVDTARDVRDAGRDQIKRNLYDRINAAVQSPNFLIGVELRGDLSGEPSVKKVAAEIRAWLDTLDPDVVAAAFDPTTHCP